MPAAVSRQQTLGSLRVTSRSRYGDGAEGSEGWTASGGHAARLRDSQTTDITWVDTSSSITHSSRPVLYTRATGRRLSRRAKRLSGISRCNSSCNSTLFVKRQLGQATQTNALAVDKGAYCVLGMSHICITLYTKACYIARGRHDDRPLGAYTCRRLALSQSLPSLPLPILHVPTPKIPVI